MRLACLIVALQLFPATACAQTGEEGAKAKALYEKGMARFQLEEYDAAIGFWEEGFRNKPLPEFLYNIAQAYRLSKRPERALLFYKKYLTMSPKAPNRVDVEKHMANLVRFIREQSSVSSAPPTAPIGPGEPRPGEPRPSEPQPSEPDAANQPALVVHAQTPPEKPIYKKGWFWGVIGGAAAVVIIVGVGVGVGATSDPTASFGSVNGN